MNKSLLALALALSVTPVAALAQDTNAPPQPTAEQWQAMHQAMQQFAQQEDQMRDQMRAQILSTLTPVHRRAIGAEIGNLVISSNPDPSATAKRIDTILSPGEQQRIIQAHATFEAQSRQLHDQMKAQMQSQMPAGHPEMRDHLMNASMRAHMRDAGWIVLHALPPHEPGMMSHMPGMPGMGGPPSGP